MGIGYDLDLDGFDTKGQFGYTGDYEFIYFE